MRVSLTKYLPKILGPALVMLLAITSCSNPVTESLGEGPDAARSVSSMPRATIDISTVAQFQAFIDEVLVEPDTDGNLLADLDISSITSAITFEPIGTAAPYLGTFNGNGHTLNIDIAMKSSFVGLFGVNNGTIQNLTLTGNITVDASSGDAINYVGSVAAYNDIDGTIQNVVSKVTIETLNPDNIHNIGGIAGFNGLDEYTVGSPHYGDAWEPGGVIRWCRNMGDITGGYNKIGGIVGENAYYVIECSNFGTITVMKSSTGWIGAGGIVGRNGNNEDATEHGLINFCYNRGVILDETSSTTSHNGYGGITGWCNNDTQVTNCYSTGDFIPESGQKNPIIGRIDATYPYTPANYSLDDIYAESPTDTVLSGIRMSETDMKDPAFVTTLNNGAPGPGPFVAVTGDYPKLYWE